MADADERPLPIERPAARVIVLDEEDRVLLLHGHDPDRPEAGSWWFTPGGGVDPGETPEQAARRELFEETGIELAELGPVVHERSFELDFQGARYLQHEVFFAVRIANQPPAPVRWTEVERRVLLGAHWRSLDELRGVHELRGGAEPHYPDNLVELIDERSARR